MNGHHSRSAPNVSPTPLRCLVLAPAPARYREPLFAALAARADLRGGAVGDERHLQALATVHLRRARAH